MSVNSVEYFPETFEKIFTSKNEVLSDTFNMSGKSTEKFLEAFEKKKFQLKK